MLNARMTDSVSTPGRPALAEQLGDDPFAFQVGRRVADDLEGDLVAGPGPLGAGIAHVDRVVERGAVDLHVTRRPVLEVRPDEQPRGAGDDLDDPPLEVHPRPLGPLGDLDDHLVAAGGVAGRVGRNVDLVGPGRRRVRPDEPEALATSGGRGR